MKASQKAMIWKDVKEVFGSTQMSIPMIVVPVIMMVILPLALVIGAKFDITGLNGMDYMMKIFSSEFSGLNNSQMIIQIGVNYMFPVLFLLIPIMASSITGASSFIGEKERKTMESLLYTPMSIRELFVSKVIGTAVPAYAIAMISALIFGVIINIGGWLYFSRLIFPNMKWIILIIWITPAVTLLGITFMVMISAKANTFQEAQQMSAFVIIPVILIPIGQMAGLFMLSDLTLLILGTAVYFLDYFLMKNATGRFTPEKLI